ncbi:MAG: ABC transporter substrate-binding protein [Sphingomonadales bacterium]
MALAKWLATMLGVGILCSALPATAAPARNHRIVSIHVCADQLALMLADPGDVASVSYNALDPEYSVMVEAARGIPVNHGHAEEVISHDPDIVIAGRHSAGPTIRLLRRLGYRVLEVATANSFDDVREQIRLVAGAIGRAERGDRIIAELDARLRAVAGRYHDTNPRAVIYHINNQTIGGQSLVNEIMELVGLQNYAATLGTIGYGHLSLERLLAGEPDLLILEGARTNAPSVGRAALSHPALQQMLKKTPSVVVPSRLWACPGIAIAEAAHRLAEALK